jgi:hypothetical protein
VTTSSSSTYTLPTNDPSGTSYTTSSTSTSSVFVESTRGPLGNTTTTTTTTTIVANGAPSDAQVSTTTTSTPTPTSPTIINTSYTILTTSDTTVDVTPSITTTTTKTKVEREVLLDNRHVIPYNPALSFKFNAHINVEYCASIKSVKYLHKYVYKGPDRAHVAITVAQPGVTVVRERDEVKEFIDGRYVSCSYKDHC